MKKLDISDKEFTRIDMPDSPANNFDFDIHLMMSKTNKKMVMWSVWTDNTHTSLYIEFVAENRAAIDMLEIYLDRQREHYSFEFGFVNQSTHELTDHFRGLDPKGALYIKDIRYLATSATA